MSRFSPCTRRRWRVPALCLSLLLCPLTALGAGFDSPSSVVLSPQNARLTVEGTVAVISQKGGDLLTLTLPPDARDLTLTVPGHMVAQWSSTLASHRETAGVFARRRAELLEERVRIQGEKDAAAARLKLWSALPPNAALSIEELARRETQMQTSIPALVGVLNKLAREADVVEKDLAALPAAVDQAQIISLTLAKPVPEGNPTVPVRYSYTLPKCGWKPVYAFDALPDQGEVRVRLSASVWQYSGMDWTDADITLVAQGDGQREPSGLRPWRVRQTEPPAPGDAVRPEALMSMPATANAPAPRKKSAVVMQERTAFASWNLGKRSMKEGASLLTMTREVWKAPLQWLARPRVGDDRVWLMVEHTLPATAAWPAGEASFAIEDNAVGVGAFAPRNGKATLFFGVDPRVTVQTEADERLSGKTGIIDRRKTWSWAWNFTVHNGRGMPVAVRLEQPEPQPGHEDIAVICDNSPEARKGPGHTLYWDLPVPARGKAAARYAVTISAPKDMAVQPGR